MKLIVGLGNPGILYAGSKHNAGFQVIKYLSKQHKAALRREKGIPALCARADIADTGCIICQPLTFMNLSGLAVGPLVKKYKIDLKDLLVVCDDLDLEIWRVKIRPKGSSAGHRGIQSIIDSLHSDDFARLRLGIGRPHKGCEPARFVLSGFKISQKKDFQEMIDKAAQCCQTWVESGIADAMNTHNRKKEKEPEE